MEQVWSKILELGGVVERGWLGELGKYEMGTYRWYLINES